MALMDISTEISRVMDLAGTLENLGDDVELLQELMEFYMEMVPQQLDDLQAVLEAGDVAAVDMQAHGLKGGSANVGAIGVTEVAREMEMLAKGGSLEGAVEMMGRLRQEFALLAEAVPNIDWASLG